MSAGWIPTPVRELVHRVLATAYRRCESAEREDHFTRLRRQGTVSVGVGTYGTPTVFDLQGPVRCRIAIGNYCSIGPAVVFMLGGEHRTDFVSTFPFQNFLTGPVPHSDEQPTGRGDIIIGHDVWIGYGVFISSGVTIGTGAVVGAGSVVRRNVDPYEIVRGNPCRPMRKRFSDEHIAALLESGWWNWPIERIRDNLDVISSPNVDEFLGRLDK